MRAFLVYGFSRYQSAKKYSFVLVLVLNEMVLVLERRLRDPCDPCRQITPSGSLQCDRYSAIVTVRSLRWFIWGCLSRRACQKNYSINAGKIGINDALGCCFNLSRHKAIERVVDALKLSRLGSYNRREVSVRLPLPRFDASL
jgi:hypothetical protein